MGYQEIPKELLEELKRVTFIYLNDKQIVKKIGDITYEIIKEFEFDKVLVRLYYPKYTLVEYEIKGMKVSEFKSEYIVNIATNELKEFNCNN